MSQYLFNGVELPNVDGVSPPVSIRVGKGETPMRHGGYIGKSFMASRQISVSGQWLPTAGQTFEEMELAYALFTSQLVSAGVARLYLRRNWFYNAILENIGEGERDFGKIEYDFDFFLADPRQYKFGTNADGSVDAEGSTLLTWGSTFGTPDGVATPMRLELTVTAGYPADVTFTPAYTDPTRPAQDPLLWSPGATGITIVYFDEQRAERSNVDVTSEFDGNFFEFPANQDMEIDLSSGSAYISGILKYREARL